MDPTDATLVQRSRDGDRRAFDQLIARHAPGLFRLAAMTLAHAEDARDVVQETLLGAFQGLHRFRGDASVRTWLVQILMRQIARHRRHESYRTARSLDSSLRDGDAGANLHHGDASHASDARMDVADLLGRLSPEHREVLVLRELEGLSYDEMAGALQVPRGTVESRLFRARQALREAAQPSPSGNRGPHDSGRPGKSGA